MNDLVPKLFVATVGAVWAWVLPLVSAFAPPVVAEAVTVVVEAVAPEDVGAAAVLLPDDNESVLFAIEGLDFFPPDFFIDFFVDFDACLDFAATIFFATPFCFLIAFFCALTHVLTNFFAFCFLFKASLILSCDFLIWLVKSETIAWHLLTIASCAFWDWGVPIFLSFANFLCSFANFLLCLSSFSSFLLKFLLILLIFLAALLNALLALFKAFFCSSYISSCFSSCNSKFFIC